MSITISKDAYVGLQLEGRPSRVAARRVEQAQQLQVDADLRSDCVALLANDLCVACHQANNWTQVAVAMRFGNSAVSLVVSPVDALIAEALLLVLTDVHNVHLMRGYRAWCAAIDVDPFC